MYAQPNPALRAALNAAAFLEQKANPIAPGPGGTEIKSVAGNLMDAVHQDTAPTPDEGMDMGATGGMGGMGGGGEGLQGILANLSNAVPTMQQNAQNAQADQIASMAAAKMQGNQGGIGAAPAPMGFAEGGILGFTGGKEVPKADDNWISRLPEDAMLRKAQEWIRAGRPPLLDKPVLDYVKEAVGRAVSGNEPAPEDTREYVDRLRVAGAPAPAPAAPSRAPAGIAAAPAGGGGGGAGAGSVGGLGGLDKFLAAAMQQALAKSPATTRAEQGQEEYEKALREQPIPGMTALEALRKSEEQRQALYKQAEEEQPMRQLRALLSGIHRGGLGGGMEATQATQEAYMREKAARIAEAQLEAIKRSTIEDMQAAFRAGNLEKVMAARVKLAELDKNDRQILGTLAGHAMSTMGHIEGAKIGAGATLQAAQMRNALAAALGAQKQQPKLNLRDELNLRNYIKGTFFNTGAERNPEVIESLRALKSDAANRLINDIKQGRVKYDLKTGWGQAENTIQQAAKLHERRVLSNLGAVSDQSGATPYDQAVRMLSGD